MKIRHINNIVIVLENWEAQALLDFIEENIKRTLIPLAGRGAMKTIRDKLDELVERKA